MRNNFKRDSREQAGGVRKIGTIFCALLFCLISLTLFGCSDSAPEEGGNYSGKNDILVNFTKGLSDKFKASDWESIGGAFDCRWSKDNVAYNESKKVVELKLTRDTEANENHAAEYRSNDFYGYGYYSVRMKASPRAGVVSAFFTFTNKSDGNPWDEIDIEFLGYNMNRVQFNYFSNGVGGHEKLYNLGFDASKEFHEYGFQWTADAITWYVDSVPVHSATESIPKTAGRIFINAWIVSAQASGWGGLFDNKFPVPSAEYEWISYRPL